MGKMSLGLAWRTSAGVSRENTSFSVIEFNSFSRACLHSSFSEPKASLSTLIETSDVPESRMIS